MVESTRSRLIPDRKRVAVAFLVLVAVATAIFAPTFDAYVATHGVEEADVRVTDVDVGPDGDVLALAVRFENPTRSEVTVLSGQITATVDGTTVTRVAGTAIPKTTVAPGEAATLDVEVHVSGDHREAAVEAARERRLWFRGHLWVTVGEEHIKVRVRPHRVQDDAG